MPSLRKPGSKKVKILLQRILHPVGQGSFFSEHFISAEKPIKDRDLFNVVYDCGSNTQSCSGRNRITSLQFAIKKTFTPNSQIDLLFISHFDKDHINGLPITLQGHTLKVKHLFLPLLNNSQRILIGLSSGITKFDNDSLKKRFNAEKITYVSPHYPSNNNAPLQYDSSLTIIPSGTPIQDCAKDYFWEYIPYNIYDNSLFQSFLNHVSARDASLASILKNIDKEGAINELENNIVFNRTNWEAMKSHYRDYKGIKRNDSSLIVYSGPVDLPEKEAELSWRIMTISSETNDSVYCKNYYRSGVRKKRVGALYTGDINLNITKNGFTMEEIISHELEPKGDKVGLLQIPHHGSKHNFNPAIIQSFPEAFCCFYAFGTDNHYGHPFAGIRMMLLCDRRSVFEVTEQPRSEVIQIIEYK